MYKVLPAKMYNYLDDDEEEEEEEEEESNDNVRVLVSAHCCWRMGEDTTINIMWEVRGLCL